MIFISITKYITFIYVCMYGDLLESSDLSCAILQCLAQRQIGLVWYNALNG